MRHSGRSAGGAHAAATLAAGGGAKVAADIFRKHDSDGSGLLEPSEMMMALQELGVLEGLKAQKAGEGPGLVHLCWCISAGASLLVHLCWCISAGVSAGASLRPACLCWCISEIQQGLLVAWWNLDELVLTWQV